MLIEEVYRSQDLDATLSSMSDDEDEDEEEEAYLPPLKGVVGETMQLPVAGVRQRGSSDSDEEGEEEEEEEEEEGEEVQGSAAQGVVEQTPPGGPGAPMVNGQPPVNGVPAGGAVLGALRVPPPAAAASPPVTPPPAVGCCGHTR